VFDDPAPLHGQVLRPDGESAAGLAVRAHAPSNKFLTGALCEMDGSFALHELPAGRYRLVVARGLAIDGRVLLETSGHFSPDKSIVLQLTAERGSLRGRAVDERGMTLRHVEITLAADDEVSRRVISGEDGTFVLDELPPVSSTLRAHLTGHTFVNLSVEVAVDGVTDLGDLVVPHEAGLRVHVLRPDGSPWITAPPVPWLWRGGSVVAGRDRIEYAVVNGEVLVRGLAPGTYELRPPRGDLLTFTPLTVDLRSGAIERVELHMQPSGEPKLEPVAPPARSTPQGR
jgi:hypothetical protein